MADFVFLMDDDTYKHFEFQTSYNKKDLTRFSRYDTFLYDRDGRKVQTVIIYSADVKKIDEELDIGSLTYKPTNVMMYKFDGNKIYKDLEAKLKEKQELTDIDMLNLIFLPLMSNSIPKDELALRSIELAKTIGDRSKRETCIVSTIAFTGKYLTENEMTKIWEVAKMTDVIGRLIQKEVDIEVEKEVNDRMVATATELLNIGFSVDKISKITGLDVDKIEELKKNKIMRREVVGDSLIRLIQKEVDIEVEKN